VPKSSKKAENGRNRAERNEDVLFIRNEYGQVCKRKEINEHERRADNRL